MTIIRRPDRAEGGITDEERGALDAHARRWIDRILRTDPIDPEEIGPAIRGLYRVSGLPEPRVVVVPSPLVMAVAGGFAAAIWAHRGGAIRDLNPATRGATRDATRDATDVAIRAATGVARATYGATYGATAHATDHATRVATYGAIRAATGVARATDDATARATDRATDRATRDATDRATLAATDRATDRATLAATDRATDRATWAVDLATRISHETGVPVTALFAEARSWYNYYQGGSFWGQYDCYLTACRDVLGLRLPEHAAYHWWEQAAIHGGYRFMHPEFCMVSDFPAVINRDEEHRPHCATGPSLAWRDGWALYHWHGVTVPAHWIVGPAPTAAEVLATENVEVRTAGLEILGWGAILSELDARVIDQDHDRQIGTLYEADLPDAPGSRFLRAWCPAHQADVVVPVPSDHQTALAANAWTYGVPPEVLRAMQVRT